MEPDASGLRTDSSESLHTFAACLMEDSSSENKTVEIGHDFEVPMLENVNGGLRDFHAEEPAGSVVSEKFRCFVK